MSTIFILKYTSSIDATRAFTISVRMTGYYYFIESQNIFKCYNNNKHCRNIIYILSLTCNIFTLFGICRKTTILSVIFNVYFVYVIYIYTIRRSNASLDHYLRGGPKLILYYSISSRAILFARILLPTFFLVFIMVVKDNCFPSLNLCFYFVRLPLSWKGRDIMIHEHYKRRMDKLSLTVTHPEEGLERYNPHPRNVF